MEYSTYNNSPIHTRVHTFSKSNNFVNVSRPLNSPRPRTVPPTTVVWGTSPIGPNGLVFLLRSIMSRVHNRVSLGLLLPSGRSRKSLTLPYYLNTKSFRWGIYSDFGVSDPSSTISTSYFVRTLFIIKRNESL